MRQLMHLLRSVGYTNASPCHAADPLPRGTGEWTDEDSLQTPLVVWKSLAMNERIGAIEKTSWIDDVDLA